MGLEGISYSKFSKFSSVPPTVTPKEIDIPEFLDSGRKSWMLESGRWMLDSECWSLDSGRLTLDAARWSLDTGLWTMDSERWKLDCGLWGLDAGLWMLKLLDFKLSKVLEG